MAGTTSTPMQRTELQSLQFHPTQSGFAALHGDPLGISSGQRMVQLGLGEKNENTNTFTAKNDTAYQTNAVRLYAADA